MSKVSMIATPSPGVSVPRVKDASQIVFSRSTYRPTNQQVINNSQLASQETARINEGMQPQPSCSELAKTLPAKTLKSFNLHHRNLTAADQRTKAVFKGLTPQTDMKKHSEIEDSELYSDYKVVKQNELRLGQHDNTM